MGIDFDKQADLATKGFTAPIIGLIISIVLSVLETIPTDQTLIYIFLIWSVILVISIGSLLQDTDSIRANGPVYGICFVISFCLINGICLKIAVIAVLLAILIYYILFKNRDY